LNPLLYGFYQFLKLIVRLSFRIFYPYKIYIHPERLRFDYPAILVSNHPNTLVDPLTVAAKTRKLVFFLANAGLFKSGFGHWFFNTFYCIPVQRPQDATGKKSINNVDSFARANEHLAGGGVLYIAPEGASEQGRRVRPFKTGTARIALSTEKKNDFDLGMAVIPVGLTYYRQDKCGSRMIVNVGEPVFPKTYREAYEADPVQTARDLTADLHRQMGQLLINTEDEREDERLRMMEAIVQHEKPLKGADRFQREMELLAAMREKNDDPFFELLDEYRLALRSHRVKDAVVRNGLKGASWFSPILVFPIYLYGLINNFLPARIPRWLNKKLDLYPGYYATVKILTGLITFPLFYYLQTKLVGWYFGEVVKWGYLLSLPVSGVLYWRLSRWYRRIEQRWRYRRLSGSQKESLQQLRKKIVDHWF
jgi:1-acyl-sn-glycerol-3-phosphate acyltransferase